MSLNFNLISIIAPTSATAYTATSSFNNNNDWYPIIPVYYILGLNFIALDVVSIHDDNIVLTKIIAEM